MFTVVPRPVTLDDDVPIGASVISLVASDSDGTAPGNQVRFEIIGRGSSTRFFAIEPDSGVVRVRDDLRKSPEIEHHVDVRVYDLGEPQLSSVTSVLVLVRHLAVAAPELGLGFAEESYNVEVPEDADAGTLIKVLTVIGSGGVSSKESAQRITCDVFQGNEERIFKANITEEGNCALWLDRQELDFENTESYRIGIRLQSLLGTLKPGRNVTMVKIQVVDVNDNQPEFIFPRTAELSRDRYFAQIPLTAPYGTTVLEVKAQDADNGRYGKLEYALLANSSSRAGEFFAVDPASGIVRTIGTFDGIAESDLPFRFSVSVRDNPNASNDSRVAVAPVIVNLVTPGNILVLSFQNSPADHLQKERAKIVKLLEDKTKLLIEIERFEAGRLKTSNGTIEIRHNDADLYFYAVDPDSEKILPRNSSLLHK